MHPQLTYFLKLLFIKDKEFYFFLCHQLHIAPRRISLYETAFRHKSASTTDEDGAVVNNERLEYLGDAVLDAIVAAYLFKQYPDKQEGFLTQVRSKIVQRANLGQVGMNMGLDRFIICHTTRNVPMQHICGDAFEALIGALYLDQGYKTTEKYVINYLFKHYIQLDVLMQTETDFKSRLIEWTQKHKLNLSIEIPDQHTSSRNHAGSSFTATIRIGDLEITRAQGHTKKAAEQHAAEKALQIIPTLPDFEPDALAHYIDRFS